MTIWCVSKPINNGCIEVLHNNRKRNSPSVAIKNTNKDMGAVRLGGSVCLMALPPLDMSGQASKARLSCNDAGIETESHSTSGSTTSAVSSPMPSSFIASFAGIGQLRIDCIGSRMWSFTKTMHRKAEGMPRQIGQSFVTSSLPLHAC